VNTCHCARHYCHCCWRGHCLSGGIGCRNTPRLSLSRETISLCVLRNQAAAAVRFFRHLCAIRHIIQTSTIDLKFIFPHT
jgi:hypothetical protein